MDNQEIEVKFLEVDVLDLQAKLAGVGAQDLGDDRLTEIIFYDKDLTWVAERRDRVRFVRLRQNRNGTFLTYKSKFETGQPFAEELEVAVSDMAMATKLLKAMGLVDYRHQEKKRHSYKLGDVMIDIDTWPKVPPYVEIEGPTEAGVKEVSQALGFDWDKGVFEVAGRAIEKYYNIPVGDLKFYTFDRIE